MFLVVIVVVVVAQAAVGREAFKFFIIKCNLLHLHKPFHSALCARVCECACECVSMSTIESTASCKVAKEQYEQNTTTTGTTTVGKIIEGSGNKMANELFAIACGILNKNPFLIYTRLSDKKDTCRGGKSNSERNKERHRGRERRRER